MRWMQYRIGLGFVKFQVGLWLCDYGQLLANGGLHVRRGNALKIVMLRARVQAMPLAKPVPATVNGQVWECFVFDHC